MPNLILNNLQRQALLLVKKISTFAPDILDHVKEMSSGSFTATKTLVDAEIKRKSEEKKLLLELLSVLKNYEEELRETE